MRALILVAGAALAVSACSSNEAAENTMNVDETLTTENVVANDTTAIDATTNIQVFGTPSGTVTDMLRRQAGAGVPMSIKRHHLGGFTR